MIVRNAHVLMGHVNDLLETSKIEAPMLIDYGELDLSHLVRPTRTTSSRSPRTARSTSPCSHPTTLWPPRSIRPECSRCS